MMQNKTMDAVVTLVEEQWGKKISEKVISDAAIRYEKRRSASGSMLESYTIYG